MIEEKWYIRIFKWLGIIKEYEVSKQEMCEQTKSICDHNCKSCAWDWSDEQ